MSHQTREAISLVPSSAPPRPLCSVPYLFSSCGFLYFLALNKSHIFLLPPRPSSPAKTSISYMIFTLWRLITHSIPGTLIAFHVLSLDLAPHL